MSLSSISIKRPVLAIVMSIVIVLFGLIGYTFLGIREYPSVDPPIITVRTTYTGANADIIESQITEPLEESVNGIAGIRTLSSVSRDGASTLIVEFDIDVELEEAANDVRERVSRAQYLLPKDCDPPVVTKSDADANPIVFLNLKSSKRDLMDLTSYADNVFKERLQTIPGVSEVMIWGEKKFSMRLWLDPIKLAAFNIVPLDISNALERENIELPSGRIEGASTELTVRTLGRINTTDEFNEMIIKEDKGRFVKIKDIGYAEIYPENDRTLLKRDGIPMVGVVLVPQPGSNQINIADEFYKRVDIIKKELPKDIELGIGFDQTKYIRASIEEVQQTVYIAFALVILIIFLFLRDWRTTLIPIIAIPVSLIGAFFIMFLFNFSINVLTLLGIVLAIGIVVDDAIVMLENIYKRIEAGEEPMKAGTEGAEEIFFAVVSTTISLAAVFLPIMFLQGITGRLFREFGIVIAGAVIISAFVALTLTPMLSTKLLKKREKHNFFYNLTEPFFVNLAETYRKALDFSMDRRWIAFIIIAISVAAMYFFGTSIPSELAPIEDRSGVRISSTAPEGTTHDAMKEYMDKLTKVILDSVSEKDNVISIISPSYGAASSVNSGFIRLSLVDPSERERSQQQIAAQITKLTSKFNDARTFVIQDQSIGVRTSGLPVQFVLQAQNLDKLRAFLPKFLLEARKSKVFSMVDADLKFNKPEIQIKINREKAREMGISAIDIARTLQFSLSGQRIGYYISNGKQYQIISQVERRNRSMPLDLKSLSVRNKFGELVQLDNIVNLVEESAPPQLYRYNRFVSATVSASLVEGKTIGDGIDEMKRIASITLDDSFQTALAGNSKDFMESSSSLLFTFMLALVLVFLILAAQFESFRDPIIIMFAVPLAIAGSLASLWYFDQTMNIFSQIGQIMLIGLVTKNGILIVEFANQKKKMGLSPFQAVKEAAQLRFRPILMTSLSTVLGTLPIALALGAGSESRSSMGIAIISGLIFSTVLTLFVIPAIYSIFSSKKAPLI